MRKKYIEKRFPLYTMLVKEDSLVDVTDGQTNVLMNVSKRNARSVMKQRDDVIAFLYKLADAFNSTNPIAFEKFWYHDSVTKE